MTASRRPGYESPIFVGGVAKSGKTPLRRVLEAHPDLQLTRRTYLWTRFYGGCRDLSDDVHLERFLRHMVADPGVRILQPDVDSIMTALRRGPATYTRLFALFHAHHAQRLGRRRWGDQLGKIELYADAIFADFPAAKMIHMVRDPRNRGSPDGPSRLGWEIAEWRRSAEIAVRNRDRWADGYLVLPYEMLAADPEPVLRDVCRFLGEELRPTMVDVLSKIDFQASNDESEAHVAMVERYALEEMIGLGYGPRPLPIDERSTPAPASPNLDDHVSGRQGVLAVSRGSTFRPVRLRSARERASMWLGVMLWEVTAGRRGRVPAGGMS